MVTQSQITNFLTDSTIFYRIAVFLLSVAIQYYNDLHSHFFSKLNR